MCISCTDKMYWALNRVTFGQKNTTKWHYLYCLNFSIHHIGVQISTYECLHFCFAVMTSCRTALFLMPLHWIIYHDSKLTQGRMVLTDSLDIIIWNVSSPMTRWGTDISKAGRCWTLMLNLTWQHLFGLKQ